MSFHHNSISHCKTIDIQLFLGVQFLNLEYNYTSLMSLNEKCEVLLTKVSPTPYDPQPFRLLF